MILMYFIFNYMIRYKYSNPVTLDHYKKRNVVGYIQDFETHLKPRLIN